MKRLCPGSKDVAVRCLNEHDVLKVRRSRDLMVTKLNTPMFIREYEAASGSNSVNRARSATNEVTASNLMFGSRDTRLLRGASVCGVTLGRDMSGNTVDVDAEVMFRLHVMAYDLECEFNIYSDPLIGSDIIRINSICSCGVEFTCGRHAIVPEAEHSFVVTRSSSTEIAQEFMSHLCKHMPHFTVAHNGYSYDNRVLAYHLRKLPADAEWFNKVSIKAIPYIVKDLILVVIRYLILV